MENLEIVAPGNVKAVKVLAGKGALVVEERSKKKLDRLLVGSLADLVGHPDVRARFLNQVRLLDQTRSAVVLSLGGAVGLIQNPAAVVERLMTLKEELGSRLYPAPDDMAVRRMIQARRLGTADKLIASARVEGGTLTVWSCEPRRYEVEVSKIPALKEMSEEALADFVVSDSGSRMSWEEADVDLGLEDIRYYAEPAFKRLKDQESKKSAQQYVQAIRALRKVHELKQTEIPGLTERQVRRIEKGESYPRKATLASWLQPTR